MAKFLTTSKTVSGIEHIITNAKTQLVLISPFLQLTPILFERLQHADEKGVSIIIVYGKDELKQEVRAMLTQLEQLKLYFYEHLHAKCYYNEQHLVITSMNLFAFSERHNREMGVYVQRERDSELYREAVEEAEAIIRKAELVQLRKNTSFAFKTRSHAGNSTKAEQDEEGYCIRCQTEVDFDPEKPLCYSCYQVWAGYYNASYPENYCHDCGKERDTTVQEPLCMPCERKFLKKNPGIAFRMG